jgi:hypothetical protein
MGGYAHMGHMHLYGSIVVEADAIAVRVGSGPQEILPEDRAWGFAFL